jgi:photosystem II stability/assembly factor-like uncharacterized protein
VLKLLSAGGEMKKFTMFLILLLTTSSWAGWAPQTSNTTLPLYDVCFADSLFGWAVGGRMSWVDTSSYLICLRTTDGGTTWLKSLETSGSGYLTTVTFINRLHGWAMADSGLSIETTDGGVSWHNLPSPNPALVPFAERFVNDTFGYMLAGIRHMGMVDWANVGWTTDGGLTWYERIPRAYQPIWLVGLDVQGPRWAWATGAWDSMVLTRDAGSTWVVNYLPNGNGWNYGVAFGDTSVGVAVGDIISRTSNGGFTWAQRPKPVTQRLTSADMPDTGHAWACGGGGVIIVSTDGGRDWNSQTSGTASTLNKIWFINERQGWTVGNSGVILHTNDGGQSGIEVTVPAKLTGSPSLYCFPNPSRGPMTIRLMFFDDKQPVLSVFNALGRLIKVLKPYISNRTSFTYIWDGCDSQGLQVSTGVYFVRLEYSQLRTTQRIIVVR